MKNRDKYKTFADQDKAFGDQWSGDDEPTLDDFKYWLDAEFMGGLASKCPFCGHDCEVVEQYDVDDDQMKFFVRCNGCGYESPSLVDPKESIKRHNDLCSKVEFASEEEPRSKVVARRFDQYVNRNYYEKGVLDYMAHGLRKALYPVTDLNLGEIAAQHGTESGDDPAFDRLYNAVKRAQEIDNENEKDWEGIASINYRVRNNEIAYETVGKALHALVKQYGKEK